MNKLQEGVLWIQSFFQTGLTAYHLLEEIKWFVQVPDLQMGDLLSL